MKEKLFLLALVCLAAMPAFSQKTFDQVEGDFGLNFSSMTWMSSKLGFHAGVRGTKNLDSQIYPGVYANVGALLSLKGGKMDLGELCSAKMTAYYLDIPIHIGYKHALNDDITLFGEAGPFIDLGLFGNQTSKTLNSLDDLSYDKESYNTFDTLKRFDFGLGFRIGAELKKYIIAIGYDAGIANIYSTDYDDDEIDMSGTVHSSNFYISAGIKF